MSVAERTGNEGGTGDNGVRGSGAGNEEGRVTVRLKDLIHWN